MCGRLGDPGALGDRTAPDSAYTPCAEFLHFFNLVSTEEVRTSFPNSNSLPNTYVEVADLFYRWTGAPLKFLVYRGDALKYLTTIPSERDLLSTIIDLVPSISWAAVNNQVNGPAQGPLGPQKVNHRASDPWRRFCEQTQETRDEWRIASCRGPNDKLYRLNQSTTDPIIPCTSLAYILATSCAGQPHPDFPQDNFVFETWHTTYTMFGAYFDLGRREACRAVDTVTATLRARSGVLINNSCEASSDER
jgi:hypothetical protein